MTLVKVVPVELGSALYVVEIYYSLVSPPRLMYSLINVCTWMDAVTFPTFQNTNKQASEEKLCNTQAGM